MITLPHYTEFADNRGRGRPPKYPLRSLKVGESTFLPGAIRQNVNKAICNLRVQTPITPIKFRCRTVCKGGITGVRVTRIV